MPPLKDVGVLLTLIILEWDDDWTAPLWNHSSSSDSFFISKCAQDRAFNSHWVKWTRVFINHLSLVPPPFIYPVFLLYVNFVFALNVFFFKHDSISSSCFLFIKSTFVVFPSFRPSFLFFFNHFHPSAVKGIVHPQNKHFAHYLLTTMGWREGWSVWVHKTLLESQGLQPNPIQSR